jgi:hypothetical protein
MSKKLSNARLELLEHLKGELMIMLGVDIKSLSKQELAQQLNEISDVAEAILTALHINILEYKDGFITATMEIGEL